MLHHSYSNREIAPTKEGKEQHKLHTPVLLNYSSRRGIVLGVVCRSKSDESNICSALQEVKTETLLAALKCGIA